MKTNRTLMRFVALITVMLGAFMQQASAQCNITNQGSLCVGSPIQFFSNSPGATNILWKFGDPANGQSSQSDPSYTFNTPGTYTVTLTLTTAGGAPCNTTKSLTINPRPTVNVDLINNKIQCYQGNQFCFTDSSLAAPGSTIKSIKYLFDDAELITVNNPTTPRTFCKSFTDPGGGTYGVTVEIEDVNGCITKVYYSALMVVRASAQLNFTSNKPQGCDSVLMKLTNNSLIPETDIAKFYWDFGDGTIDSTNWGPSVEHMFRTQGPAGGNFTTKLTVKDKFGCIEEYIFPASALNLLIKPEIIADKDSTCYDSPRITFGLKDGPVVGATGFVWNFGDPDSGPLNIDNKSWSPNHAFTKAGPFRIVLTFVHPVCGNRTVSDTILIIGPQSTIDIAFNRIPDNEVYQCHIIDTLTTKNFSAFYHNDRKMTNDDSTFTKPGGKLGHVFNGQTSVQSVPQLRNNHNVMRLWDFDDDYAERCTTDSRFGINMNLNCRFSRDSLPNHMYTDWDTLYKYRFSRQPYDFAIFDESVGLCFRRRVFASDSMYSIVDTILVVGNDPALIATANATGKTVIIRPEKEDAGIQYKLMLYNSNLKLAAGDTVWVANNRFQTGTRYIGPATVYAAKGKTIILKSTTDKVTYGIDTIIDIDTISKHLYQPGMKIVQRLKMAGYGTGDSIDPDYHRELFFKNTPKCFNLKLWHKDTVHPLACEHQAITSIALMPPSAKKLRKDGVQCLGSDQDNYGITFILEDTKPGCTQTNGAINTDTATDINNWIPLVGGISAGNLPPGPPAMPYPITGRFPIRYSTRYTEGMVKDSIRGWVHVGLAIQNGVGSNACYDTIYYPNFARFPVLDNRFVMVEPIETPPVTKVCRYDTIAVALHPNNRTYTPDVERVVWKIETSDAGRDLNQYYRLSIVEDYFRYKKMKPSDTILTHYMVRTRNRLFGNSADVVLKRDTIITGKVYKYHYEADISQVFNVIKTVLDNAGFDIYELSNAQLADMMWNGMGTFGDPLTGSRGCIDTTGLGSKIKFYAIADSSEVLHYRDENIKPTDSMIVNGSMVNNLYYFIPEYNGFYVLNMELFGQGCTRRTGNARRIIVGYYNKVDFTDTIVCHGTLIEAEPMFRYFEAFPDITFQKLDPVDWWRNRVSQAGNPNREGFTKWDFSREDDNPGNPATIFGGTPYSITSVGTPMVQLSSSLYYKDHGRYTLRVASMDSTGCVDTIFQPIYVTDVIAGFRLDQDRPQCKTIVEFFDTSKVLDPCSAALGQSCDKIVYWEIDWGDGKQINRYYYPNYPPQVGHDYTRNGTFRIKFKVKTELNCEDSTFMDIVIPGPIPVHEPKTSVNICKGQSVTFRNTSINPSSSARWIWNFGDNFFQSDSLPNEVTHTYNTAGTFEVYLTQFDSIPGTGKYCSAVYPDTTGGSQQAIIVNVIDLDTVKLTADKTVICPGETVVFTSNVTPPYDVYKWKFGANNDTLDTPTPTASYTYNEYGVYTAHLTWKYTVSSAPPCPGRDSIKIFVDTIRADFDIDSTNKPIFCFTNTSRNATSFRWGFYHASDITLDNGTLFENSTSADNRVCENMKDSLGGYWVCLEATNQSGCIDTICKFIWNNFESLIKPYNVFTPSTSGGDGANDLFDIEIKGEEFYELKIFNRWGDRVFESNTSGNDWNGKINNTGAVCPDGTYFWILKYRFKGQEKEQTISGTVTVIWQEK